MSVFKQSNKMKMQEQKVRNKETKIQSLPRFKGRAELLKLCKRYLENCNGWNPLADSSLNELYAEINSEMKRYKI